MDFRFSFCRISVFGRFWREKEVLAGDDVVVDIGGGVIEAGGEAAFYFLMTGSVAAKGLE